MRSSILTPFIVGVLILVGCGGPEPINIVTYPAKTFSGKNILHESVSELDSTETYSMNLQIDRGQTVKVIISNLSEKRPTGALDSLADFWKPALSLNTGWYILDYNYKEQNQIFYCEGPAAPHVTIDFFGCGKMSVDIYERGRQCFNDKQNRELGILL